MAWATLAQFKANQVNLEGDDSAAANAQITLSLNATGSEITSCLDNGGYSVAAIRAAIVAGAVFDLLVLLNIRLAALDLMAGGGVSAMSGANENTFLAWQKGTALLLKKICDGMATLDNSGTGDGVSAPQADFSGIVSDSRESDIDLTDPVNYKDTDLVDADFLTGG